MVLMFWHSVNLDLIKQSLKTAAWLNSPAQPESHTAILRWRIGEPNVNDAAASMMVLASMP